MSIFEVTRKIKSEKELDYETVKEEIKRSLGKNLEYNVVSETANSISVTGLEKGIPYKFDATFHIEIEGDKAKISVEGSQKVTTLFTCALIACGVFCFMLFPLIGLVVGIIRLNTNKNVYAKKVEEVLSNVNTQLAW